MKTTLTITLFLSSFLINAQDTIYFKNKTIVAAKITEVGVAEIKYQRLDNLTGPNYLSSKTEIFLIKYTNGLIDSIKSAPIVSAPINSNFIVYSAPTEMRFRRDRVVYKEQTMSDRRLGLLINELPSSEKQITLKKEFKKLNNYKLMESALAPALFVGGAGIHFAALGSAFGGNGGAGYNDRTALVSAFIAGAVLRISSHVINIVYKNKKKNQRHEIVNIYNGQY